MHRITRIAAVGLFASTVAFAQGALAPPTTGLLVSYQYWPVQYVQWVGAELPYSMIELDVDSGAKQALYNVVLTGKDGKRVSYSNDDGLVAAAKAQGMDAYKTQIAFDAADAQAVGAASTLRMSLADGKPLQWRFVQGSDVSEQGAGVTALPQMAIPVFAYREQAAVAGEGTALQIGDAVSTAEMWKEISKPPYFVAYRGAMSLSAHTTVFAPGNESWTITSAPTELKVGATWEMDGAHGNHRTLRVEKTDGTHVVLRGTDTLRPGIAFAMEGSHTADGWSIDRVRYAPERDGDKHFLSMQFTAPLTSASTASTVDMMIGKKGKMASASLTISGAAADRTATLTVQSPAWAKGKSLVEETTSTATTLSTTAKPAQ
jgi:hypothetical protein